MNTYRYLTGFPQRLSDFLEKYDTDRKQLIRQAEDGHRMLLDRFAQEREDIKRRCKQELEQEKKRYDGWLESIAQYEDRIQTAQKAFDAQAIECAKDVKGASKFNVASSAWTVLQMESDSLGKKVEDFNEPLRSLNIRQMAMFRELQHSLTTLRIQVKNSHDETVERIGQSEKEQLDACLEEERKALAEHQERETRRKHELNEHMVRSFDEELKPEELKSILQRMNDSIPKYRGYQPSQTRGNGLSFGMIRFDVTEHMTHDLKKECLTKKLAFVLKKEGRKYFLELPAGCAFEDQEFSSVIAYDKSTRADVVSLLRSLAMQLLMSNPMKKTRFTFFSPSDSGDAFAMFGHLAKADERIIDTRVWCSEKDIEARLAAIQSRAEEINLNYLQGKYDNLLAYNEKAGKNAEPLQFLFVVDFPRNFTENSLKYLEGIMSNGPKNGIYTILAGHADELDGSSEINDARFGAILNRICGGLSNYRCTAGEMQSPFRVNKSLMPYLPYSMPENRDDVEQALDTIREGITHTREIVVDFDDVMDNLTRKPERWFQFSDQDGLDIPFALTGANQPLSLSLASDPLNPCFHTVISGQTGSGKSALLHSMIISTLLRYSPEDVQMYILDFKDGIEFKDYADFELQNFRAVSIETEPEFGLAVFNAVEVEMAERAKLFHEQDVKGIGEYRRALARKGIMRHGMPRILLIIDEYQIPLKDPSDPVAAEMAAVIGRIAAQGRAYGVYLVMATQDLTIPKAVPAEVYNQFSNRIALKSNVETAQLMLPNYPNCDKLVSFNPGQAIFNPMLGDKDHNTTCRIAYATPDDRRALLARIQDEQKEVYPDPVSKKPTRLLIGGVQDDTYSPLNCFARTGEVKFSMELGYRLFLGEALAMENNFLPVLRCEKGQNLLMLGNDQSQIRNSAGFVAASLLSEAVRQGESLQEPVVTVFDFSTGFHDDLLQQLCDRLPNMVRLFTPEDLLSGLEILHQEMQTHRRQFVIFLGLNRARRLTIQRDAYSGGAPREMLVQMLKDGPASGMNFIVWANNVESFNDFYADTLYLFDHRLVGQIEESAYKTFLGESAPRNMNKNNAVYFNADALENSKVRLYASPTQNWTNSFLNELEKLQ